VWDATRSNGWENHNHYSGGYGGYGGHNHGRWLKSKTQETTPEQQKSDKQQESTDAAGDKNDGKSRNLLGTQEWGSGAFVADWGPPIKQQLLGHAAQVASRELLIFAIC
jgi:hypothetical protein